MSIKRKIEYTPIDGERLREALKAYKRKTGKSATWLSYKIAESGSMLSNAMLRDKIATQYVAALELAGIHPEEYVVQPEEPTPEAPETPQSEQKEKSRPNDQDLRKELQRLRDDVADLGVMINALRQDRQRDTEKLLQSLARIAEGQLTQKALGEEIVSGIILAAGQMNIDEPIRSAYDTIRNDLQRDIYRAIKGGTK